MTITFTELEIENIILSALANGGLSYLSDSGVEIKEDKLEFDKAKAELLLERNETSGKTSLCYEDIMVRQLRNDKLTFVDVEGGDDEETSFTLAEAMERLNNASEDDSRFALNIHNEEDDAEDGYNLIQLCLYNEIIYG